MSAQQAPPVGLPADDMMAAAGERREEKTGVTKWPKQRVVEACRSLRLVRVAGDPKRSKSGPVARRELTIVM